MSIVIERQDSLVDEMTPLAAWSALQADPDSVLIDVRSAPEWSFSGKPDLALIERPVWSVEWLTWPSRAPNLGFISELEEKSSGNLPRRLFFLCRSGPRAVSAAQELVRQMRSRGVHLHCTNVQNGFEGEKDEHGHRGAVNGWKASGLPWTQD
ncbi:MAG: rhodanese-like domain-containing protein [Pseudomonadota bacterium]